MCCDDPGVPSWTVGVSVTFPLSLSQELIGMMSYTWVLPIKALSYQAVSLVAVPPLLAMLSACDSVLLVLFVFSYITDCCFHVVVIVVVGTLVIVIRIHLFWGGHLVIHQNHLI